MAVVIDDVDRAGVYARSPQGRRVQPAATNRHSHTSTRRWCKDGLAVKQAAYDRPDFSRAMNRTSGRSRAAQGRGSASAADRPDPSARAGATLPYIARRRSAIPKNATQALAQIPTP